jgi:hypothetical protein
MLIICSTGLYFFLTGCNSVEVTSKNHKNVGYFVSVFNKSVDYGCEDKREKLKESGKFECNSFPIAFYRDNVKIGEISTIHSDGYVYPQDIVVLEDTSPIYTSQNNMQYLTID